MAKLFVKSLTETMSCISITADFYEMTKAEQDYLYSSIGKELEVCQGFSIKIETLKYTNNFAMYSLSDKTFEITGSAKIDDRARSTSQHNSILNGSNYVFSIELGKVSEGPKLITQKEFNFLFADVKEIAEILDIKSDIKPSDDSLAFAALASYLFDIRKHLEQTNIGNREQS